MTQKIKSLDELAIKLASAKAGMERNVNRAIYRCAVKVQATAKLKFGHYQPQFGSYPEWAKLKPDTVARKAKAGGGEDPLIGHYSGGSKNKVYPTPLRNSILVEVKGLTGIVGTNNPLGKYHEFGTHKIPPRPFLRPALHQEQDFIKKQIKEAVAKTLLGL